MRDVTRKARIQGRADRRGARGRRNAFLNVESLEGRVLLATTVFRPATTNLADVKAGPMANAGPHLTAVNQLRVQSVSPAIGATVRVSPGTITFTFSQPINFSTINASDLAFVEAPPGVALSVGAPIAVDNPTDPTIVSFPFAIVTVAPTLPANGHYAYTLQGPIVSQSGLPLASPFTGSFNLQDVLGPRITGTGAGGRVVTIHFDEAARPSSISPATVQVWRIGVARPHQPPVKVQVNADPRAAMTFDAVTDTLSIRLRNLGRRQLRTGHYAIVVKGGEDGGPALLDQAGNPLDGEFAGHFPTGNGVPGGSFVEVIGRRPGRLVR
jgi:hypothetical protein